MSLRRAGAAVIISALSMTCLTACEDDDDDSAEIAEQFDLTSLTAAANNDGTITISGSVTTNKKLKKFELTGTDGTTYDLLEGDDVESAREETEDGKAWVATLSSTSIPVQIYTLDVRTRMGTTKTATIGKTYTFNCGTSNSEVGSYMSLTNQQSYQLSDFCDTSTSPVTLTDATIAASIEVILQDDFTLKSATGANASAVKNNCAASNIYENCVIASTNLIATYSIEKTGTYEATISGVVLTSNDDDLLKIDVSSEDFPEAGEDGIKF